MRFSSFTYLVGQGLHNLRANRLMTFASMGVLTVCMLLIGAAYLLGVNIDAMVEYIGDQNETVVYMDQGAAMTRLPPLTPPSAALSTWWASPTCRPRTCWQFTATCCPPTPTCRMLSLTITRSTPTTALW